MLLWAITGTLELQWQLCLP